MKFRWCYQQISELPILDQIIQTRKLPKSFFRTDLNELPDPSLLKDNHKAALRIIEAVKNKQKIMIYGHDDLDGITSTFILYDFLEKIGSQNHFYYLPNRLTDNHGMQQKFIDTMLRGNFDLLITVDGGISEFAAVSKIQENGCDVIITDHHIVQNNVPDAIAVVNPKQEDCKYPFDMLAGVGVTYFLIEEIASIIDIEIDHNYLFWVAAGTIADNVPLVGINRILVKEVINNWFSFDDHIIKNLSDYFNSSLKFQNRMKFLRFVNRLLANGRLPNGKNLALEYMLTGEEKAKNEIKTELFSGMFAFEEQLFQIKDLAMQVEIKPHQKSLIYFDKEDNLPAEFLGFAASVICNKYLIPVIIIKRKNGILKAEARSIEGTDLVEMFTYCSQALIQYGGHKKAAGFTIEKCNLELFKKLFQEYIKEHANEIEENQCLSIDAHIKVENIDNLNDFNDLDQSILIPFGQGNPHPLLLIKNFQPKRDNNKLKSTKAFSELKLDEFYDIVVKYRNSVWELLDYRPANYML